MDHIRTLLPHVLEQHGIKHKADAALLTHRANEWLSENLPHSKEQLWVQTIDHTTLLLAYTHPVIAEACSPLLPALKEFLGSAIIEIRLVRA